MKQTLYGRRTPLPRHNPTIALLALAAACVAVPAQAQQDFDAVQIETVDVAPGIHMLIGSGGNIGVSVGEDGAFVIDDQYAPLTDKIKAAIAKLTSKPVRFVVNTHWHSDHTGGNEALGKTGAVIVAHENVRKRMSVEQFIEALNMKEPPAPDAALPVITFDSRVTFHWNGQEIRVIHLPPGHTDGDSIVHFVDVNVIHAGDAFFNGVYPFIDASSGGGIDGIIAQADRIMALADDDTRIIPGHGPLSNRTELGEYRDMLVAVRDRIKKLISEGKSRDEIFAAKPTAEFDAKWGAGFLNPDQWLGIIYPMLAGK